MRTLTCDPEIEVIGQSMLSIVHNLRSDEIRPILEKYELTDINPDEWYQAQNWLHAMNEIAAETDVMSNFVAIGMQIAENVVLPPELQNATLPQVLEAWDAIYQIQHRGGDIGYVKVETIDEKNYRTIHRHLYPDDITYGLAYGWCKRFLPAGVIFKVRYEDPFKRMDVGDHHETVILVSWD